MATTATNLLRDSTALVTGGGGFIGTHLCRQLAAAGARVNVVSRGGANAGGGGAIAGAHRVDLADAAAVDVLVHDVRPDYVFHLASHVSASRELSAVGPTFASNLASTVNLLTSVTQVGCRRFVLAGSLEEPVAGDAPSSPYAASKAAAAMYARMFHALYAAPIVTARIFMVYGPGQRDTRKLVPYVTRSLLAGESPQVSSGVRPVDWVYVGDVAEALVGCATTPGLEGTTIDVGTGRLTTVRSVVERLSAIIGTRQPVFGAVDDRPLEQVRAADPRDVAALLGRAPVDLEHGLRQTVAWYRGQ
jgi:nucleoside-diphosphate-sugar epimerase